MKINLGKRTIFLFFIVAVALLPVLIFFYYNIKKVKSTSDSVEHTQEVLRKNDNVLLDVLNIETGSRGYILTGNDLFLAPFNSGVIKISRDFAELAILTKDNPNQQLRIESLKDAGEEGLIFTKKIIELRKQNQLNETEKIMYNGKEKILTDKIRRIIAEINIEEFRLLKLRKDENEKSNNNSDLIFFLLLVFIIVILALVIIILINQKSRNKFEEELKKSSDLFSSLFDNNPASIAISNLSDGKILNVNESFLLLFGFALKEEVVGKTMLELNILFDAKAEEEVESLPQGKKFVKDFETRIKTKQGEIKWTSASVLFLKVEETPCLFSVSIDITNRKRAEEQLQSINKELEAFTYSVSHDLRAPLRAINGYAKILQEDYSNKLDEDGMSSLKAIMKNSKKMGDLIDDLLAFSRLGRKAMPTSEIIMTALVKSIKEDEMVGNSNKIEFDIHELHPAKGQQVLIKQVWVNLISNAIKYSQHNTITNIEIGSYYKDNLVVYYIKDNGVGFDMQYYDKLFGVFQRLHSQEEFEGTGIGLAIVQKIVNRHNGTVWAESKLNEGSCFYFSLPTINS